MVNLLVSIEGNIGSGKSTIMKYLRQLENEQILFVDEPVDEWINIKNNDGQNCLELFYKDKKNNSFWFQILAYITRLRNLLNVIENNNNKIIICERSIYTDHHVFAKMLYETGNIKEMEWKTYLYWFDTFKSKTELDLILYVNTDPSTCFQRINIRNRNEEKNKIEINYLENCHKNHIEWLTNSETKIVTIDGHKDMNNMFTQVNTVIKELISC